MSAFRFHETLSPEDFEELVRDVLNVKLAPLQFRTYRKGRDGGIDLRCVTDQSIVVQVKLYNGDFRQLFNTLRHELKNVQRLQPRRYILAIGQTLTPKEEQSILELFDGFIDNPDDILDASRINDLLNQAAYERVLKNHLKLYLQDLHFLEDTLSNVMRTVHNKADINRTNIELERIRLAARTFVRTERYSNALRDIDTNRYIIITGSPGIGKTTLARMLSCHYMNQNATKEILTEFFVTNDVRNAWSYFDVDKHQIFLLDDYWGSNLNDSMPFSGRSHNDLANFIGLVQRSDKHRLIITSREYILSQDSFHLSAELDAHIKASKTVVRLQDYSDLEKAQILLNHMYFSGKDFFYFEVLRLDTDLFDRIISHSNYSPRLIEDYLNRPLLEDEGIGQYYKDLISFLDDPYIYWNRIFLQQSEASRLILMILMASCDPMYLGDLLRTFNRCQKIARIDFGINIQATDFHGLIRTLDGTFIISRPSPCGSDLILYFQNPSIKDFLLHYLRENIHPFVEILIRGATYFNQLHYIFCSDFKHRTVDDFDSDYEANSTWSGKRIVLTDDLRQLAEERVLKDFEVLGYSLIEKRGFAGGYTRYDHPSASRFIRLFFAYHLFHPFLSSSRILTFIVRHITMALEHSNGEGLLGGSVDDITSLIPLIKNHIQLKPDLIVRNYFTNCTSTKDLIAFHCLSDSYPTQLEEFIRRNRRLILRTVRKIFLSDLYNYDPYDDVEELSWLIDVEYEDICTFYQMPSNKAFNKAFSDYTKYLRSDYGTLYRSGGSRTSIRQLAREERERKQMLQSALLGFTHEYDRRSSTNKSVSATAAAKHLRSHLPRTKATAAIRHVVKSSSYLISECCDNIHVLSALTDFLMTSEVELGTLADKPFDLYEAITQSGLSAHDVHNNLGHCSDTIRLLGKIAFEFFFHDTFHIRIDHTSLTEMELNHLYPFLIKADRTFYFCTTTFQHFLAAHYGLNELSDDGLRTFLVRSLEADQYYTPPLWLFMFEADSFRFTHLFALPILRRYIAGLDLSDEESICRSAMLTWNITYDLQELPEQGNLGMSSGSSSDPIPEALSNMFDINNMMEIDAFFGLDGESDPPRSSREERMKLRQYVLGTCTPSKAQSFLPPYEPQDVYLFSFVDHMESKEFYSLFRSSGMESFVLQSVQQVLKLEHDLANGRQSISQA